MKRPRQNLLYKTLRTYGPAVAKYGIQAGRKYFKARRRFKRNNRVTVQRKRLEGYKGKITQRVIKKKIRKICDFIQQQQAVHIHRRRDVARQTCAANTSCAKAYSYGGTVSYHEDAVKNLRFFNPATNTLVTADPSSGTYHRDIRMSIYRKITVVNNYQSAVEVRVYKCFPKDATNITAETAFTDGLVDQNNPSNSSNLIYPSDSKLLYDLFHVKSARKTLKAGQSMTLSVLTKEFRYQFDTVDTHALAYNKHFGGFQWLVRISGSLGHDNAIPTEAGIIPCGVDMMFDTTYTIKYDAGKDLKDYSVDDNSTSFTNSGIFSARPIVDNIGYSAN